MRRMICESALVTGNNHIFEMSDGGKGAAGIYDGVDRSCFGANDCSSSQYTRMAQRARRLVRTRAPHLLPTLNAILRNGRNRQESIFELAKNTNKKCSWPAAEKQYYRSRAKLLRLFAA